MHEGSATLTIGLETENLKDKQNQMKKLYHVEKFIDLWDQWNNDEQNCTQ